MGWAVLAGVCAVSGVFAVSRVVGEEAKRDGVGRRPVKASVHTVPLAAIGQPDGERSAVLGVEKRRTEPFSLLGVTWSDPEADLGGVVRVRTRSAVTGRWSGWRELDSDNNRGPDPGARERKPGLRGGTSPLWVGPSDGVEVRVVSANGRSPGRLPAGLRLDLVDPGRPGGLAAERVAYVLEEPSPGPTATGEPDPVVTKPGETAPADPTPTPTAEPTGGVPSASTSPTPAEPSTEPSASPSPTVPTAPPSRIPAPEVVSRAEWGLMSR